MRRTSKAERTPHMSKRGQILSLVYLIVVVAFTLFPLFLMVFNSFKTSDEYLAGGLVSWPKEVTIKYYPFAWEYYVKDYILNTIIIAAAVIFLKLLVVSLAAYGFTQFRFKGREALFMTFLALTMVPGILTLVPMYVMVVDMGFHNSLFGVILPSVAGSVPYGIFLLRSFFGSVPKDLFEAAQIDGASHFRRYLTIALPLCKAVLFMLGLSALLSAWNDLVWPRLILQDESKFTISIGIYSISTSRESSLSTPLKFAVYTLVSLPLLIVFFFTSKQFVSGLTSGAVKL